MLCSFELLLTNIIGVLGPIHSKAFAAGHPTLQKKGKVIAFGWSMRMDDLVLLENIYTININELFIHSYFIPIHYLLPKVKL